jgi:hypothetical protein
MKIKRDRGAIVRTVPVLLWGQTLPALVAARYFLVTLVWLTVWALAVDSQVGFLEKVNADLSTDYLDREFRVSFRLPPGWRAFGATRWMDNGWEGGKPNEQATTVVIRDPQSGALVSLYYRLFKKTQTMTPEQIDNVLWADVDDKVSQRRTKEHFEDYRPRAKSYELREIGGQRALACVTDFIQDKQKMSEYLVWVRNEKSRAEFFMRVPADQLDDLRKQVEPIVQSIRLP